MNWLLWQKCLTLKDRNESKTFDTVKDSLSRVYVRNAKHIRSYVASLASAILLHYVVQTAGLCSKCSVSTPRMMHNQYNVILGIRCVSCVVYVSFVYVLGYSEGSANRH